MQQQHAAVVRAPSALLMAGAITRATVSVGPPPAKGTTMVTGLAACADAVPAQASSARVSRDRIVACIEKAPRIAAMTCCQVGAAGSTALQAAR
jgi:hypothetical protein